MGGCGTQNGWRPKRLFDLTLITNPLYHACKRVKVRNLITHKRGLNLRIVFMCLQIILKIRGALILKRLVWRWNVWSVEIWQTGKSWYKNLRKCKAFVVEKKSTDTIK